MWISALEIAVVVIQTYATKLVHAGNSPTILVLIIDHLAQDIIFLIFFVDLRMLAAQIPATVRKIAQTGNISKNRKKLKLLR